jgi:hypothetical protein
MALLAITPKGLAEALRTSKMTGAAVWCGSDAITQEEYETSKPTGLNRFIFELGNADEQTLLHAVQTIEEHHPNECVWVEARTEA